MGLAGLWGPSARTPICGHTEGLTGVTKHTETVSDLPCYTPPGGATVRLMDSLAS